MKNKAPRLLAWTFHTAIFSALIALAANSDDFNDNAKNPAKWGNDVRSGTGTLIEKNQRLEYTSTSVAESDSNRPWVLTRMPYNSDWEVQIDTVNNAVPSPPLEVSSFGILLVSPFTADNSVYVEMYASALGLGTSARNGFNSVFETNDDDETETDSGETGTTQGAVRMAFNSATKVITVHYDTNRNDGYQWVEFGSFGVANANGTTANRQWGLNDTNQFPVYVYGYSSGMTISSGQVFGDNFQETGGVTSSGGPSPEPVGKFPLTFPTGNPLITRIMSVFGNFQGQSALLSNRMYNVDVAQDESGKLMGMGTLEGVQNKEGSSELAGTFGAIKTVNGQPTAQLKGTFAGTVDGASATASGSGAGPVTLMDIGGGTNGVTGTASFKGKVAGVPFAAKNLPLKAPAPPGATDNARKAWNIELDLSRKTIRGREKTVASAQLLLPNGDTISYPEKVVRYSATKGYSLSFKRGTNITANPTRLDKKSSVLLKNLTFMQQGGDWQPTGGTITYQFLGQKGTASVLDFVAP